MIKVLCVRARLCVCVCVYECLISYRAIFILTLYEIDVDTLFVSHDFLRSHNLFVSS